MNWMHLTNSNLLILRTYVKDKINKIGLKKI